nr:hypothetical protein [Burkholderia ubonensis]
MVVLLIVLVPPVVAEAALLVTEFCPRATEPVTFAVAFEPIAVALLAVADDDVPNVTALPPDATAELPTATAPTALAMADVPSAVLLLATADANVPSPSAAVREVEPVLVAVEL